MFAPEYPEINFVLAHLGSFTDNWKAHQQVAYQLARYPNVYADTSGVRQFDYLVQAIQRAGPRKLLFGSDGPWLHPGLELHKIRLLGLPSNEESLILGGNALRLLRGARTGPSAAEIERPSLAAEDQSAGHDADWASDSEPLDLESEYRL